ncbi:MAG: Crp/Fnr family transcriptional regulator [Sulfurospirillum sp.]|jgi:CRP/FNR family transcriptional regulator|uniref:Crp/Fnr family transcriptional regulator n=1 Tax=Sulfurospirillum sp. UCH001 TaxID=1581011 RepID=UPI000835A73E|nr:MULTISPECIES: Crp/Fnr family transcriptional regulator [unclassified Sulfurospirillum]WNY98386.1 Crp/Fnr family transcriptional regulator [Sulfurospirillum sp. 'SP']
MDRIRNISCFSKLTDAQLEKLKKISVIKKYKAKEILFYEGDEPTYLYVLLQGTLKVYKTNHKGQQIFLHQFYPGGLVAELANFENIPYPATAEFMSDSEVLRIDYQALEKDFFKNPEISFEIIKSLIAKHKILIDVIQKEVILTADAKVAKFILENEDLFKKLKNTQVASILNLTPETLSRTLSKFKSSGIIDLDEKHHIRVLNPQKLEEVL